MKDQIPLWLLSFKEEVESDALRDSEALALYALAQEAGLSWRGGWMARRHALFREEDRRGGKQRPISILSLAKKLGRDRHIISDAIRSLIAKGLVILRGKRPEPTYNALQDRWRRSKPANRFKVSYATLADPRLNLTDALLVGKIAKVAGMAGNRWWPTTRSLASDLGRSLRTIARSASKLLALGLVALFDRTRRGRYYSLSSSALESSKDELVIRTSDALKEILAGLLEKTHPPPPPPANPLLDLDDFARRRREFFASQGPPMSLHFASKLERAKRRAAGIKP